MKINRAGQKRRRRGTTLIEALVAVLIVTVTMMGTVGIFISLGTLSNGSINGSVSTSLARRAIEEAKNLGFANLADGTTIRYYDRYGNGGATTTSSTDYFSVTTVISSQITSGALAETALRTLIVTVKTTSNGATVETTGTYLVWGGV